MRRLATWLAVAILSSYLVFLVAMNVFLSTSLFGKALNADPGTIFISFERGWSLWPGRVHARKLVIRSSDSCVQFILRIDSCDFTFSPLDLALQKTFHVTRVNGSGITFHARQRAPSPSLTPEVVESLPVIAGLERLPLPVQTLPNLLERWDDRYWHLFSVRLENVVADDVREVAFDTMRWTGLAHITGGFYLKAIREVHVDDIHLTLREGVPGKVTVLQYVVVEPIAGTIDLGIAAFDPRTIPLGELVHRISLRTDVHGRVPDLASWPPSFVEPLALAGAVDLHRVVLRVVDGKLVRGSHVAVAVSGASAETAGHRATGALSFVADTVDDAGPQLTFLFRARALALARVGEAGELASVPLLEISGDARALDLADPFGDLHAAASLPDAAVADLRRLEHYVPREMRSTLSASGGHLQVRAKGELWYADRRASAQARLDAGDLDLRVGPVRLRAEATAEAAVASWHWELGYLDGASAKLAIASGSVARVAAKDRPAVEATGLSASASSDSLDVADPLRSFTAQLEAPRLDVLDEALVGHYLPRESDVRLARGRASFDARAELVMVRAVARGSAQLNAARLGITKKDLVALTDLHAVARVHDWSFDRGELVVDEARVVVANAAMTRGDQTLLAIPRAFASATSSRLTVADPFARLHVEAAIEGARVNDPLALNAFLPGYSDLAFDTAPGDARLAAQLDATMVDHVGRATVTLGGHGLGARGKKVAIRGDLAAIVEIVDWRTEASTLRVKRSDIVFGDVAMWIGEARPGAVSTAPDLVAKRVAFSAAVKELDPKHFSLRGVDYHLVLEEAHMDDLRPLGMLVPGDPFAFAIESGKARVAMDVVVKASDHTASGSTVVDLERAGVRMRSTHLVGDFLVVVPVHGYAAGETGLDVSDATVTMKNVRTAGTKAQVNGWGGEITLLGGALRVTEAPAFDGLVQLHFDDAQPILALTLQNSLPGFVVGLLEAPHLDGQARIAVEAGRTAILGARLRGDDVQLAGNYVVAGERVRGAVTVAKGPLSVGVKFDNGATSVRLFRLDAWMKDETSAALELFGKGRAKNSASAKPR